jgi:DNA polymerase III delta prime subunit
MQRYDIVEAIRIANHFEYQGPLTRRELFFDRKREIQDAIVVCSQIVNGTVGGVLVLGGRGSGKSSFLDALRRKLTERKIPNAKISLDEGMLKSGNEMLFIQNLLSELITASEESGLIEENLASKVLGVLSGTLTKIEEVGVDIAGFSLVARAAKDPPGSQFPYTVLRNGLRNFLKMIEKKGSEKTVHGAIILLDEGDLLTLNRNLLQILRNVLQETPRIGLVVSASSMILSQVSNVFSPIQRFFRKIELGPYPAESIVYDAIKCPIELTTQELMNQGIKIEVIHQSFDRLVAQISGRNPIEINMLCYFALDLSTRRIAIEPNGKVTLYMRGDRELFDVTIKQLVGSREYQAFISELDKNEISCLVLLSKSLESSSNEEITMLLSLHELGDGLTEISITDLAKRIEKNPDERSITTNVMNCINQKGQSHKITVFISTLMGKPLYSVDDQWVRAYFKLWLERCRC